MKFKYPRDCLHQSYKSMKYRNMQRWKNVRILRIYPCNFLAVLIFWPVHAQTKYQHCACHLKKPLKKHCEDKSNQCILSCKRFEDTFDKSPRKMQPVWIWLHRYLSDLVSNTQEVVLIEVGTLDDWCTQTCHRVIIIIILIMMMMIIIITLIMMIIIMSKRLSRRRGRGSSRLRQRRDSLRSFSSYRQWWWS